MIIQKMLRNDEFLKGEMQSVQKQIERERERELIESKSIP